MGDWFRKFVGKFTSLAGSPMAFFLALGIIALWLAYAIPRKFSSDSQIPVNTLTTIVTFLMVFLIQNAQNRDTKALHLKLDELIVHLKETRNEVAGAEKLPDKELDALKKTLK